MRLRRFNENISKDDIDEINDIINIAKDSDYITYNRLLAYPYTFRIKNDNKDNKKFLLLCWEVHNRLMQTGIFRVGRIYHHPSEKARFGYARGTHSDRIEDYHYVNGEVLVDYSAIIKNEYHEHLFTNHFQ